MRAIAQLERDIDREHRADIVVLTVPGEEAQAVVDRVVKAGIQGDPELRADAAAAPRPTSPSRTVNMAMELEGLSFALTNRD